jgi:hypothetical protein
VDRFLGGAKLGDEILMGFRATENHNVLPWVKLFLWLHHLGPASRFECELLEEKIADLTDTGRRLGLSNDGNYRLKKRDK